MAAFVMDDLARYELKIAGLLHDCGKMTTPVHVVDKATKLQTLFDRMELIDTRFEVLKRDAEIAALRQQLALRPGLDVAVRNHPLDLHGVALLRVAQPVDAGFILIAQWQMQGQVYGAVQAQLAQGLLRAVRCRRR